MSTTIDQRVVEMRFDNKQFESNVQTTLSTLDKLKRGLNLTGASKGLEDVGSAARKLDMSGLGRSVEMVSTKFSALQVMGVTALANITNSAVNAGKRIASALTIDPIKTGFSEYETKINAIQTIMSNTASKGTTMEDVTRVIGELNTYADKTIYNFAEMTRNIGTFTAAGVGLEESATAIQGIANLAAVSGSNSQQASTAMYQLSQAMAAGTVKLMDWNSVVNAGMGGQVFQDALKDTARAHGVAVDDIIKKQGSFRESLSEGWITTEILTETLSKMTKSGASEYLSKLTGVEQKQIEAAQKLVANNKDGTASYDELAEKLAATGKVSKEEAISILKMADNAEDAATKVKTFTQLWDTLKESAQSGWSQSWEIIVGDFEEAKELFTEISDIIGGLIGKSADARNKVLQGWKDLGGRTMLVESLRNVFEGIMSIVEPISEAFREIFPPVTAEQLVGFTKGLKDLTAKLKISDTTAQNLKKTFKGVFAVVDIFVEGVKALAGGALDLIKNFAGIEDGILGATGSIGEWLSNLRDSVKEGDLFAKAIGTITGFLSKVISKIKEFGSAVSDGFKTEEFTTFADTLKNIWSFISKVGSQIVSVFSSIGSGIAEALDSSSFFDALNSGIFAGILATVFKFSNSLSKPLDALVDIFEGVSGKDGIFENLTGILDDVRGCFTAYQNQLKAGTLMKIATAIGVLAAAIFVLSTIDGKSMDRSIGAITILFAELLGSLALFSKIGGVGGLKDVTTSCTTMIAVSISLTILASALKKLSAIDAEGLIKGLVGIGALMAEISLFLKHSSFDGKLAGTAMGIVILSTAMLILAKAVKNFGQMNWTEIGKGLASIGALLAGLSIFTKFTGNAGGMISIGVGMVLLGASMKVFASAVKDFSGMNLEQIGTGLLAMAGALAEVTIATRFMPKNMMSLGAGMVIMGAALKIMADVLSDFGGMGLEEILKGLGAMGGVLAELAIALNFMNGTLAGSAALIIAAGALAIIAPVMKTLGGMDLKEIGKALLTLAGAFVVIGVAGAVLSPLIPAILGLSAAFTLLGIGTLGLGAGLTLIGVGISAIATAVAGGATAIVAGLTVIITGLLDLIPTIADKLGKIVLTFCEVIIQCAPKIAETLLVVISEVFASLAEYTPNIVNSLMEFLIGVLDSLASNMPTLISSAMNLIGSFFQGIIDALSGMDTTNLIKGIAGVGLIAALIFALSALTPLLPGAMAGIIGVGVVVAELALVLAAIGALSQIPGLSWLIEEGGDFLQTIGTAIGQFVGGIVAGFAEGAVSTLPEIGTKLSEFMTNVKPFIEGAKTIDEGSLAGVRSLVEMVAIISGASILDGIASFITGTSSIDTFSSQLNSFANGIVNFSNKVKGNIDAESVTAAANAGMLLAELQSKIPASGGIFQMFSGSQDLETFGTQLLAFGTAITGFSSKVKGNIDEASVMAAANAGKMLAEVQKAIPENKWLDGKQSLSGFGKDLEKFGEHIAGYASKVSGADFQSVSTSVINARKLASFVAGLSGVSSDSADAFRDAINSLAKTNVQGFIKAFSGSIPNLKNVGMNMANAILTGIRSKQSLFLTSGGTLLTSFQNGLRSRQSIVTSFMTTLMNNLSNLLKSKQSIFLNGGRMLMERLSTGIKSQSGHVKSSASSILNGVESTIRGYYNDFYSAGKYLVEGFANGITANTWLAEARAADMARASERAAKAELREHSPSKAFYEIGAFAGMGLVNALGDYAKYAGEAGGDLAKSAVEGLSNPMSKIVDILNGDIDIQPGITPVIDLSNIKSGVRSINAMFSKSQAMSIGANIRTHRSDVEDLASVVVSGIKDALNSQRGAESEGANYTFNIPLEIDGREVARATATYTETELNKLQLYTNRKRGFI